MELNLRLTSRGPSENSSEFYKSIEKNALIPQNFKEYINLRSYKVSLLNGFAGMLDKSSKYFAWLFKVIVFRFCFKIQSCFFRNIPRCYSLETLLYTY